LPGFAANARNFTDMLTFSNLVDEVRKLGEEEIQELESIVRRARIEKSRRRFLKSHAAAIKQLKAGKLKFSSDIATLKRDLGC
jgi:uncharacterized NAD(P)/FAD-binding protein YdhS